MGRQMQDKCKIEKIKNLILKLFKLKLILIIVRKIERSHFSKIKININLNF